MTSTIQQREKNSVTLRWVRDVLRFFYPYIRVDRLRIVALCGLSLVTIGTNAFLIWMLGHAVSQIAGGEYQALERTLITIGVVVLINQSINLTYSYIFQTVTLSFVDRVRSQMLAHIMRVSFPILSRFDKGDLMSRLSGDVDAILAFVTNIPLQLFSNVVVTSVYLSLLIWIDWRLTGIALLMAPVFFLSQRYIAPRTGAASRNFVKERVKLVSAEEQTLSNLRGISAFNGEEIIRAEHQQQFSVARSWAFKLRRIRIKYNTVSVILLYIAGVIVVYSGISSIQSGRLAIGSLVSFLMYARFMVQPVRGIARIPTQLERNRVSADRVMEVMWSPPAVQEAAEAPPLKVSAGRIDFDSVTFTYPNSPGPVFENLSLTIGAGECVALVGPSGSGKSTLAGLALRFFDPDQGEIRIDGTNIRSVALRSLRENVSIVWQQPYVFNGTIRANLRLARPDATEQQMRSACEAGHAWEFISQLESGLDTVIGTQGVSLSVGQVQRLAIAQAFLRDSPIMILDEASSALDSRSEQMVVEALQALRRGRTTLIIAHRFSTVRTSDKVVHFNGDGTVSLGTHAELMQSHPMYRTSVEWQTGSG